MCGHKSISVLQCVAVCCSVLQRVAVCCSGLQWGAVGYSVLQCERVTFSPPDIQISFVKWIEHFSEYIGLLRCRVLHCVAACCSVVQLFCGMDGALFQIYRALFRIYRALLRIYMALLKICRALFRMHHVRTHAATCF